MPRPLRVFLCHASQDKPTVWKLYRYLKQHGVLPWLDREDLLPGEDWEVEIPKALFASDVILVCLSKNSVNKEGFVQKEITFALDKALEKPEGTIFIIPVKLEECDIPKRLTRYQWVDLSRVDGRRRLLMGLNKRTADLGQEVQQITLDDTRRTTVPKSEIKKSEEQIVSLSVKEEIKEEPKIEIPVKPFTKLLDPSSLYPNSTSHPQGGDAEKTEREKLEIEAIERAKREKAERDAKEKNEREAAEKAARKKLELEAMEKAKRETAVKKKAEREARQRKQREFVSRIFTLVSSNSRSLGVGGIVLFVLIFGGVGLNYLVNNLPVAPIAVSSPTRTITPKPPTFTSASITHTPQLTKTLTPTPTKTPILMQTLGIGSTMTSEKDGMTLLYVPAGKFIMGSDTSDQPDKKPEHQVDLKAFWIDQTEVTNAMYARCVAKNKCDLPNDTKSHTRPNYYGNPEFDNYPVIYVSWKNALAYCSWAERRLPTEAEWEKVADGSGSGGVRSANVLWWQGVGDTTEVGIYTNGKSLYGALDMVGNVWEWVSSLYKPYPYDANDGRENINFLGDRVLRGGSWHVSYGSNVTRLRGEPTSTSSDIGFRCSRSP